MGLWDWLNFPTTNGFWATQIPGISDSPHFANDIGTPFHTPITALWSGTVVEQQTGLPWGTELFIKPDNGGPEYYYYHLDTLNTHTGQHVNAGDLVGLSGGQNNGGSNPSTPQMSTGAHTHVGLFTSWINVPGLGTRPYGPDITSFISAFRGGNSTSASGAPAPDTTSSGIPGLPFFSALGQKIGLLVVALILFTMGFYVVFSKQINSGIEKGVGAAKKGVEVAAVA
jgi:peptidase M23-like protein